jgi:hypothetical protein
VKEALENAPKKEKKPPMEPSFEKSIEEKKFEFPKYNMVDEMLLGKRFNYDVKRVVRAMVDAEAPLSEEWLLKRTVSLFGGREKVTSVVRERFDVLMRDLQDEGIVRKNGFLYLQDREIPMLRVPMEHQEPRDMKYIDVQELANGLRQLLKQNVTAEKDGLFKLLANQLGFARIGDAMETRLQGALALIAQEVEVNGEMLSLKNGQ